MAAPDEPGTYSLRPADRRDAPRVAERRVLQPGERLVRCACRDEDDRQGSERESGRVCSDGDRGRAALAVHAGEARAQAGDPPGIVSAWPFKEPGDSGTYDYYQYVQYAASSEGVELDGGFPDTPWWVEGLDACVWSDPVDQAKFNYQQWDVDGCVPVASPWIWVKAFKGSSWKIYCPGSAPYNWAAIPIGAQQFWFGNDRLVPTFAWQENYHPGWSDHSAFNKDLSNGHHWKLIIGCSPIDQSDSVKHDYSNGEGPTGKPSPCCGVLDSADAARGAVPLKGRRCTRSAPPTGTRRRASSTCGARDAGGTRSAASRATGWSESAGRSAGTRPGRRSAASAGAPSPAGFAPDATASQSG